MASTSPWLSQLRDAQDKEPDATTFALATLATKPFLRPRVRHTLSLGVVESADNKSCFLLASASAQSSKVQEILGEDSVSNEATLAEIAWLFPKQQLQFRILALGHIIPHSKHSSSLTSKLTPTSQLSDGRTWQELRTQEAENVRCSYLGKQYSESKNQNHADEDFVLLALNPQEVTINRVECESQRFTL